MARRRFVIYMLTLALVVSAASTVTACAGFVTGSRDLETREMDFSDFTRLTVSHAFQVNITRADSFFVSITADDNLFDYIDVSQTGSTLKIGLKPGYSYTLTTERATITMPDLRGLSLSGACTGDISGFSSAEPLELEASGASSLSIDDVVAGDTDFNISGASRVTGTMEISDGDFEVSGASTVELAGTAADVSIEVSGVSSARLEDFPVVNATIKLSGASSGTINASGRLNANVSGASRLYYTGNPTLDDIEVSGASTVSQK